MEREYFHGPPMKGAFETQGIHGRNDQGTDSAFSNFTARCNFKNELRKF